ncbi:MAG TPA: hypothetical protein VJB93_02025 [Patescibacteria group bacterium]|nr:hypothetical protein [Patescibacteria group bacterium]
MRAAVIGASGRIGQIVISAILGDCPDAEIVLVGRRLQPLQEVADEKRIRFPVFVGGFDVTDESADWERLWKYKPEIVVNASGPIIGYDPVEHDAYEERLRYNTATLMNPLKNAMEYFEEVSTGLFVGASGSIAVLKRFPNQIAYCSAHTQYRAKIHEFQERHAAQGLLLYSFLFLNGIVEGTQAEAEREFGMRFKGEPVSARTMRGIMKSVLASPTNGEVILRGNYTFKPLGSG